MFVLFFSSCPPPLSLFPRTHLFFLTHLRVGSLHPLILHCVFPKNKNILLHNHSAISKCRTFNTSIHSPCACLVRCPQNDLGCILPSRSASSLGPLAVRPCQVPSGPFHGTAFLCCMTCLRNTGEGQACHRTAPHVDFRGSSW